MADVITEQEKRKGPTVDRRTRERNIERTRSAGRKESTGASSRNGSNGKVDMSKMEGAILTTLVNLGKNL